MIKVINIISDSNIGGAGKCILNFSEHYKKDVFDLTVVVPKNSSLLPELKKRNVKVVEAEYIADCSFSIKGIIHLYKIIKNLKPDIVHTHASMSGRIAARLAGVKKILYTLHCVYEPSAAMKSFPGKLLNKIVSNLFSTHIIAVAEAAKENLIKTGINKNKISVVLNGITPLNPPENIDAARVRFGVKPEEKVVSIIARLERVKGHKYFIDAAEILRKKGINARFIIAGAGSYEEELKKYSESKNNPVYFAGFVPDPESLIGITHLSVNASYGTEATSISLLEGMSLGVPAVVSNYGGNPGVIKDGVNGYIFPVHSSEILAEKLESLLNDDELYNVMSKNAIKIFNETFTANIYTQNIEKIYLSDRKDG